MVRTFVDAGLIVLLGLPVALGLNAISPRGLSMGRDYFPSPSVGPSASVPENTPRAEPEHPPPKTVGENSAVKERLAQHGLSLVSFEETRALHQDPRFSQGLVVFVDARDDAHYQEGHIPGAFQFDHYRMEKYIGEVLPICQVAEKVVVYCTGGNCEDSEFAAIDLVQLGIPPEQLAVFGGGILEWGAQGMEIEHGDRLSGKISKAAGETQ